MKTVTALCILLIFQYVHGSIRLFFPHFLSKLLIEIALLSLIFSVFMRGYKLRLPPGLGWLMAYVFLVFISGAYNGNSLYSSYRFCRFPMYSYLCFFAAWNAKLNIRAMRQIMLCLLLLWSLQIIMAVLQIASIGQAERYVGTMSSSGGSFASIFPLFAGAYAFSLFLYAPKNKWLLVIAFAVPLIGYASAKRAIWFFYPMVMLLTYLSYLHRERKFFNTSSFVGIGIMVLVLMGIFLYGIRGASGLYSAEKTSAVENIKSATLYAREYTLEETYEGKTGGRTGTSLTVLKSIKELDMQRIMFGLGPFSGLGAGGVDELNIAYGIVGWASDALFVGWPAAACYILFYLSLWYHLARNARFTPSRMGQGLYLGTQMGFVVFVICHFFYSSQWKMWGTLPFSHMCLLGMLISPWHRWVWQQEPRRKTIMTPEKSANMRNSIFRKQMRKQNRIPGYFSLENPNQEHFK